MATSTFSIQSLIFGCDAAFPAAGLWHHMTLLKGSLTVGLGYVADAGSGQLTTAAAHGLVTGSRVRLVGGTLPSPLLANTDYFAIVFGATVIGLASSLANANATVFIPLVDVGAGPLTLTEQPLSAADPLLVLVNKEVSHPSWAVRVAVENLGVATGAAGVAEKPVKVLGVSNSDPVLVLSYQHYLFIAGGSAVVGDVSGTGFVLCSESGVQAINPGEAPRALFLKLRARNV